MKFLEMFFSNLLLDTNYELKDRYMHIVYVDADSSQSINSKVSKSQSLNLILWAVLWKN